MSSDALLELKNVHKKYPLPNGEECVVLSAVDLKIWSGSSTAIVGPSGSGKSTLLHIAGLLDKVTSGDVILSGENTTEMLEEQKRLLRRDHIGFVFQDHQLLPQATVLENVLLPCLAKGMVEKKSELYQRALDLINNVGLSERINHVPGQLSGGECQRVAVIRSMINKPKLILADEPSGALDKKNTEQLCEMLLGFQSSSQVALMLVTHSMDLADRMQKKYRLDSAHLIEG